MFGMLRGRLAGAKQSAGATVILHLVASAALCVGRCSLQVTLFLCSSSPQNCKMVAIVRAEFLLDVLAADTRRLTAASLFHAHASFFLSFFLVFRFVSQ